MNRAEKIEYIKKMMNGHPGHPLDHSLMSNDEKLELATILRRIRETTGNVVKDYFKMKRYGATEEETLFINRLLAKYSMK
jgi:hypothetical protein